MQNPNNETQVGKAGKLFSARMKIVLTLITVTAAGHCFGSVTIHSPRGAEVFGSSTPLVPAVKTIRIQWTFPVSLQTADLIFKIYNSPSLSVPTSQWNLLTSLPGYVRSVEFPADKPQEYFFVTRSNFLGETSLLSPLEKKLQLQWNYPAHLESQDLVFKVYHSTNLSQPVGEWALLTNVPGNFRSISFSPNKEKEFYVLTASNYLGESKMATR
jgi:hypothetical protein